MPAKPCAWCQRPISFLPIRGGKVLPFEHRMVALAEANDQGWAAIRGEGFVFLKPTSEISARDLEQVSWVAIRHYCLEYRLAKMRIAGLTWAGDDVKAALLDLAKPRSHRVPRSGRR